MFVFYFIYFCFNDFDMLVGVELDRFGVEIGCEHHMFVNMHQIEIEKQICLNFSNCMIFWGGSRELVYLAFWLFFGVDEE